MRFLSREILHEVRPRLAQSGSAGQGKGRRPRWLATAIGAGSRLADFAVLKSLPKKLR
jgi:hypothetical protein